MIRFVADTEESKKYVTSTPAKSPSTQVRFVATTEESKKYIPSSVEETRKANASDTYNNVKSMLEEKRRQAQVDMDVDTINDIDARLKRLRADAGKTTVGDRLGDMSGSVAADLAGSVASSAGTIVNLFEDPQQNRREIANLQKTLNNGYTSDGKPLTEEQRLGIAKSITEKQRQIAKWESKNSTVNKLHNFADIAREDATKFNQQAKKDLGAAGQVAVDLGIGAGKLAAITAASSLVPVSGFGNAITAVNVFGNAAQDAREAGAPVMNQVVAGAGKAGAAVLSGKLFNISKTMKTAYGKGFFDDAVSAIAKKPGGQIVMSFLTEFGEEFLEALAYPAIEKMTYNKDAKYDSEWFANSLYESAIAGILGAGAKGIDVIASTSGRNSAKESPATQIAESEGSNAPKENVAQKASESDSVEAKQELPKFNNELVQTAIDAQSENGRATNKVVEAISKNADALAELNVNPSGKTASQIRAEVRQAIESSFNTVVDQSVNSDTLTEGSDGVGAANFGFDPYSNLQNQTSDFHPEGANAARPVEVPTTDFDGRNVPKSASTVMGARVTPDQSVVQLEKMIASGELSFDTITDKDSVNKAKTTIAEKTFGGALEQYRQAVNSGVASKDNTTLGQQLLIVAMQSGDVDATAELLSLYTRNSTTSAQAMQAQSIFRKLSPEGQLVAVQKAIDAMNQKYGTEHAIDSEDVKAFLEAKDADARKEVEKRIVKKAAQDLPKTFKAKFDTLRYLAMLGNARTHIRNILGNSLFQIPVAVKNRVGAGLELIANKASGGKIERTKSLTGVNPFGDLAKDARADWVNVKDFLEQNRSYSENRSLLKDIEGEAHAFKDSNPIGATINALSDANSNLLAAEDTAAKRLIYTQSLAGYLKANGCKRIADASPELLNRARTYAANEALRNTFNDTNALSEAVGRMSGLTNSDNAAIKAAGYVVEGVLPFKKTPANILVRAEEYSPIGAGIGIINTIRGTVKGDTATISKGLEQLAAGATGTALLTLGALAAGNGWVTGKEDEDEKQAGFDELTGHQNYALELKDGTSITLDWLAPEAIPFFVGVELYNAGINGRITPSEFFTALKNSTAPMLEMSLLQSLNDTVENASYAKFSGGSVLGSLVSSALTNYLTQVIPTIGGQMERASEEERMTTYTDKNSDLSTDMQYTIGKVSQRIPGWDYQQIPYIDAWGRTESTGDPLERAANNLFNPAYMSEVDVDNVETELQRLYDAVGTEYGNPFPQRADKSFDVDGNTKNLSADEYVKYAKAKGNNSYHFVQQAMQSPEYKSMNNAEKAEFVADMYGYANYKAKKSIESRYKNNTYDAYAKAEAQGIAPTEYSLYRLVVKDLKADKDKNGESIPGSKKEKVIAHIDSLNLSPTEKDWLFLLDYESKDERTNLKNLRQLPWNQ